MRENEKALWVAAYCPYLEAATNDLTVSVEVPRYRVIPAGNADRWIAETNPEMSRELQEECARLIAETLSNLFRF